MAPGILHAACDKHQRRRDTIGRVGVMWRYVSQRDNLAGRSYRTDGRHDDVRGEDDIRSGFTKTPGQALVLVAFNGFVGNDGRPNRDSCRERVLHKMGAIEQQRRSVACGGCAIPEDQRVPSARDPLHDAKHSTVVPSLDSGSLPAHCAFNECFEVLSVAAR